MLRSKLCVVPSRNRLADGDLIRRRAAFFVHAVGHLCRFGQIPAAQEAFHRDVDPVGQTIEAVERQAQEAQEAGVALALTLEKA